MNAEFRYLSNGEVWALDPDAPHRLYTSVGITLAVYPGTHAGHLVEEAITDRYCYPAGDGWARAGECLDENGLERWKWRREWMPVLRSERNAPGEAAAPTPTQEAQQ